MRPLRRFLPLLFLVLAVFLAAVLGVGEMLSRPAQGLVGAPPPDLGARAMSAAYGNKQTVAGWFLPGRPGAGAVLLLHGIRGDRRQMTARARFLARQGYSVLWLDLPAHGESSGERMGFGKAEGQGVAASLVWLRQALPGEKQAVIAVSLGGAALLLANPRPPLAAVVLESVFPGIEDAVANRLVLRLGAPGAYLAPLLLWQLPVRLGVAAEELRPIAALPALAAPVLIVSGERDERTTVQETRRLFQAAPDPKELWIVPGAGHENLHGYGPGAYEERVSAFLARHLGRQK